MGVFLPSEIARLVLGYLEEENCTKAYEDFLSGSPHLRECRESNRNLGFFFAGYNLIDILDDYCAVNNYVLNYHSAKDLKKRISKCHSLLEKVKFICDKNSESLEESKINSESINLINKTAERPILNFSSASIDSSLNTTNIFDLPGNSSIKPHKIPEDSGISSQRKSSVVDSRHSIDEASLKNPSASIRPSDVTDKSLQSKTPQKRKHQKYGGNLSARKADFNPNEILNVPAISAFLDCKLHEKIAENINNLLSTSKSAEKSILMDGLNLNPTNQSLEAENDPTQKENAIKSIVEETEKDPMFDQFLDVLLGMELTSETESDALSRLTTSTPEKSAQSLAEDSSPTPINRLNESIHASKRKLTSKETHKFHKVSKLSTNSQPKFPSRLSRGGKRMDLLRENYTKINLSDNSTSNETSPGSPHTENYVDETPAETENVQEEKSDKVKILSDELVCTNLTNQGNIVFQKVSPAEVTDLKSLEINNQLVIKERGTNDELPLTVPNDSQGFYLIEQSSHPSSSIAPFISIPSNVNLNLINSQPSLPTTTMTAQIKHSLRNVRKVKPSEFFLTKKSQNVQNQEQNIIRMSNVAEENVINVPANVFMVASGTMQPGLTKSSIVNNESCAIKQIPSNQCERISFKSNVQSYPGEQILIIDPANLDDVQEVIVTSESDMPIDPSQVTVKTPNVPITARAGNTNSASRKNGSHVRVLNFNDPKKSKKELIKNAFMSPIRILDKSHAISKSKSPHTQSPMSKLNKLNGEEVLSLSQVWSDTLGVNQIIKQSEHLQNDTDVLHTEKPHTEPDKSKKLSWDAKLRKAVESDIEKLKSIPRPRNKIKKSKKTPKKNTQSIVPNLKNEKTEKLNDGTTTKKVASKKGNKPSPKKSTSNDEPDATFDTKEELSKPQPELTSANVVDISLEKPKFNFINPAFSMNTLLDTPLKSTLLELPMNTPKFIDESNLHSVSAIKIDEIPTPLFKKTPITQMISLFGTPGSGSSIPTDYSSCSSYYKPDEIEELYFNKNDDDPDKTITNKDKKEPETEKENVSDRILRPRTKSTKYADFILPVPKTSSALNNSSPSTLSDSSLNKSFSDSSKGKNISPKFQKPKISPESNKEILKQKISRVKSKLSTTKPKLSRKTSLKKVINKNQHIKQNYLNTNITKNKLEKMNSIDCEEKTTTDKSVELENNTNLPVTKSRRKSSTPRKVDKSASPLTDNTPSPEKKKRGERCNLKDSSSTSSKQDEHFPSLKLDPDLDSEDDFEDVKQFVPTAKPSSIKTEKPNIEKMESCNENDESEVEWSEYDLNSAHPNYFTFSPEVRIYHKKYTVPSIPEFSVSVYQTAHDCDEERRIKYSNLIETFQLWPGFNPKMREEEKKREEARERKKKEKNAKIPKLIATKSTSSCSSDQEILPEIVTTAHDVKFNELETAISSIVGEDHKEFDTPKKKPDESNPSVTSDQIILSKSMVQKASKDDLDSLLSILHD